MSRRTRAARAGERSGPQRERRSGPGAARLWIAAVLVLAVGVALILIGRQGTRRDERPTPAQTLRTEQISENLRRSVAAKNYRGALLWAQRLDRAAPDQWTSKLELGLALHNAAWNPDDSTSRRASLRTSLDRLRWDLRALTLLDSAATLASTREAWAHARLWEGLTYEVLGLPVDALQIYYDAAQAAPNDVRIVQRGMWVMRRLKDPLASGPDSMPAPPSATP